MLTQDDSSKTPDIDVYRPRVFQDLSAFRMPRGFRGRSAVVVQLWWLVECLFFRPSPQIAYKFRVSLLRLFGAEVGENVIIRPSVKITYPWKVKIGDNSWIGDEAWLYSLGPITIGRNTVISQRSYLCAGTHDCSDPAFQIQSAAIAIGDQVWLASDVFVAPGLSIGNGTVVGARSSVFSSLPAGMICYGSPCTPKRPR